MLELRNIAVDYADQPIISNLSLAVATKEIVSLVGPSGSGKTTLLRVIAGLEKPRMGSILIDGSDISAVPTHQRGIGLVFQDNQLFPPPHCGAKYCLPAAHAWIVQGCLSATG